MRYTCLRLRLTSNTDDLPKVSWISESRVGEEIEAFGLVEGCILFESEVSTCETVGGMHVRRAQKARDMRTRMAHH